MVDLALEGREGRVGGGLEQLGLGQDVWLEVSLRVRTLLRLRQVDDLYLDVPVAAVVGRKFFWVCPEEHQDDEDCGARIRSRKGALVPWPGDGEARHQGEVHHQAQVGTVEVVVGSHSVS